MRHIKLGEWALRVEYTIKHSFTDCIVFGLREFFSPFPLLSALRRPKILQPFTQFWTMYYSLKIGGISFTLMSLGSPSYKWELSKNLLSLKNLSIMTEMHPSLWRSTALQLRRRATRNSSNINFAYWYVFLRTLYTAAALRLYTIHAARRPSPSSIVTISQFYNMKYEACGAAIDRLHGNRWYS